MNRLESLLAQAPGLPPPESGMGPWPRLAWLDRLDRDLSPGEASEPAVALRRWRLAFDTGLEAFYEELRRQLRQGRGERLAGLFASYRAQAGQAPDEAEGFDALDELVAGLLRLPVPAPPEKPLAVDMVAYQPTPARHVLDLVARTGLGADDVLVDIGAGLGQVPMLVALCSPARALGIEIEPALVRSARQAAAGLALSRVAFQCQDVAAADLSTGTVFYLYTPLRGRLMAQLLDRLRAEAARRPLRVCGFGPCVQILAAQPWLRPQGAITAHRVAVFARA